MTRRTSKEERPMATTRLRLPAVSPTCGKRRLRDEQKAQQALETLRARELAEGRTDANMLHTYRCAVYMCWHIGHRA
jgi:hypothetical protein